MVSLNRCYMLLAMGNTYPNVQELRALGFKWFQGERSWKLALENHPMNTRQLQKKLLARLHALEENGVRFVRYTESGIEA